MPACLEVEAAIASPTTALAAAIDEARAANDTNEKRAVIASAVRGRGAGVLVLARIGGERAAIGVGIEAMTELPSTETRKNHPRLASPRNPPNDAREDLQSIRIQMMKTLIWPSSKTA